MGPRASFLLRVPVAVPSHPYGVTLLNCDGHSMTLGWKVPRYSGGAPILGYYLDRREAQHRNWHEVNSSPIKERIFTVGPSGCRGQGGAFLSGAQPFPRGLGLQGSPTTRHRHTRGLRRVCGLGGEAVELDLRSPVPLRGGAGGQRGCEDVGVRGNRPRWEQPWPQPSVAFISLSL